RVGLVGRLELVDARLLLCDRPLELADALLQRAGLRLRLLELSRHVVELRHQLLAARAASCRHRGDEEPHQRDSDRLHGRRVSPMHRGDLVERPRRRSTDPAGGPKDAYDLPPLVPTLDMRSPASVDPHHPALGRTSRHDRPPLPRSRGWPWVPAPWVIATLGCHPRRLPSPPRPLEILVEQHGEDEWRVEYRFATAVERVHFSTRPDGFRARGWTLEQAQAPNGTAVAVRWTRTDRHEVV